MLRDGQIRPVVNDRLFSLDQTIDAIDYLASGPANGRVVLTV